MYSFIKVFVYSVPIEHALIKIYYKYNTNLNINETIMKCLIQVQEDFHKWLAVKEEREVINTRDNIQVSVYTSALEIKEENADTEEYSEVVENTVEDVEIVENLYAEDDEGDTRETLPRKKKQDINGKRITDYFILKV